jgi:hypothetical protein
MKNKKISNVLKFETKKRENKKDSFRDDYYIIINGIADLKSYYYGDKPFSASFTNKKVIKILLNQKFETLSGYLAKFDFDCEISNWGETSVVNI